MPDVSSYNGIDVGDIASINGQDVPSGGGASEPSSGIIALGGAGQHSTPVLVSTADRVFTEIVFHSSVSSPLAASAVEKVSAGRQMVGIRDDSANLWMSGGSNSNTGSSSSYGGYNRQFAIELTSVADFSCGKDHSLAVKTDGTLWGIGKNGDGPLGRGDTSNQYSTFVDVGGGATTWSKVSCGEEFSLAIKTDGTLWSAGKNSNGRTGQGTTSGDTTSWTQIGSDTDWTQISTGDNFAAAIKGGTLMAWGEGNSGRLGLGSNTDQTSPQVADSDTDWQSVHCGAGYIKAIKTADGHHYHSGTGGSFGGGTRGDGSTSSVNTFTRIGSDTGWTEFLELKYTSFAYYAGGKKGSSWYACGRYDGAAYIKTGGTATTSNTTTFVELASPAPSIYALCQSEGSKPEALYIV